MDQAPVWFEQSLDGRANIYDVVGEPVSIVRVTSAASGALLTTFAGRDPLMQRAVLSWSQSLTPQGASDVVEAVRRRDIRGLLVNWRWVIHGDVQIAMVAWIDPSPWISELAFPTEAPWYHPMPEPGGKTVWDRINEEG